MSDPFADRDIPAIRAAIAARAATRPRGPEQHEVADVDAGGVPGRLFEPTPDTQAVLLYLHGGGWSVGDVASFDRVCRRLATTAGVAVLALEYRLAPEHPHPASVDDTVAALRWLHTERWTRVIVGGDSAGATLAALGCLRLRDDAPDAMPAGQLLVYGNFDLSGDLWAQVPVAEGEMDAEMEHFLIAQWVPDAARLRDADVSPLRAEDLRGLPPSVLVSAERDPLRVDADAFAQRLREAGVEVRERREPGLGHNFLQMDEVSPQAAAAADRVARDATALAAGQLR